MKEDFKVISNLEEPDDGIKTIAEESSRIFGKPPLMKRLLPKSAWLAYNKWSVKNDELVLKIEDFWEDLLLYPIFMPIKRFYDKWFYGMFSRRIPTVWAYSKILWHDFDWDWSYLVSLMHLKISRMEKNIRKFGHLECSDDVSEQLRICKEALNRLNTDQYTDFMYEELEELHPDKKRDDTISTLIGKRKRKAWLDSKGEKQVIYECASDRSKEDQYFKDFRKLNQYYEDIKQKDLQLICHIMSNRLFHWWD